MFTTLCTQFSECLSSNIANTTFSDSSSLYTIKTSGFFLHPSGSGELRPAIVKLSAEERKKLKIENNVCGFFFSIMLNL